mmetsp:Transcript_61149/g.133921  ORF Transcript_61149/g.133921 Transcript_61149/m.133921 type:complete len:273 (-) Transcript_61149:1039-1857(-)
MKRCLQTCWGLLSHLDAKVEQSNWEATGDFTCDPKPVVLMNLRGLHQCFLYFVHVVDAQVTVLQDEPAPRDEGGVVLIPGHLLLPFAHGYLVRWELLLSFGKFIDHVGGISSSRKQVEDRFSGSRLLVNLKNGIRDGSRELRTQLLIYELSASDANAVLPQGSNQCQSNEGTDAPLHHDSIFKFWHGTILRLALIKPLAPADVVPCKVICEVFEDRDLLSTEAMSRQLDGIQPDLLTHPFAERTTSFLVLVQRPACLQEDHHIFIRQVPIHH